MNESTVGLRKRVEEPATDTHPNQRTKSYAYTRNAANDTAPY